jgi:hypothetical protein
MVIVMILARNSLRRLYMGSIRARASPMAYPRPDRAYKPAIQLQTCNPIAKESCTPTSSGNTRLRLLTSLEAQD